MTKFVKDLMRPGVLTCEPTATLGQVAILLDRHNIHALFVVGGDGRILGLITDFDLLAGEWLSADSESLDAMRNLTAGDLMSKPVDTIESNVTVAEAADQFIQKGVARFLVMENGTPVGTISLSDFVASVADAISAKRETVGDVMSEALLVCRGNASVLSAARSMTSARWRSVVAVDAKGKLLGIVSGYDLLHLVKKGAGEGIAVRDVMHEALIIDIHASLREAADKMIQNHHHRLVVIDDKDPDAFPLGVISSFDIVAEMARPDSVWQK